MTVEFELGLEYEESPSGCTGSNSIAVMQE